MIIPVFLELRTVLLNIREKEVMEEPQVVRVFLLEKVKSAQACEERSPCPCKAPPNF